MVREDRPNPNPCETPPHTTFVWRWGGRRLGSSNSLHAVWVGVPRALMLLLTLCLFLRQLRSDVPHTLWMFLSPSIEYSLWKWFLVSYRSVLHSGISDTDYTTSDSSKQLWLAVHSRTDLPVYNWKLFLS